MTGYVRATFSSPSGSEPATRKGGTAGVRHLPVNGTCGLSTLDSEDARAVLRPLVDDSARELATLREAIAADATTPPDAGLPFGRLAAEYGVRSFQTLHDWALWALNRIDQAKAPARQQIRR
jgi:PadR family transcriptional regulator, regulatory protein AphA